MWFVSILFLCTKERPPPQLLWSASKDTNVSSIAATWECYEPENKRKYTEPERERMSGDLMELNGAKLLGDETDSDNGSNKSDEDFVAKKAYFILSSFA